MKRKPEVRPRKCRVYFYSGPVIQLRITGLFHSTKNDINFSLSVNYSTNIDEIPDIIDTVVEHKADVFAFARYCPTSEEKDVGIEPYSAERGRRYDLRRV